MEDARWNLLPTGISCHFREMKRNKIKVVDSLTFKEMESLKSLKMQRNGITKLMDGAFFGLDGIEELWGHRLHSCSVQYSCGWQYDCCNVAMTMISKFLFVCRELEHNNLTEVNKGWLYGLRMLRVLRLNQNTVGIIRPDAWEFCQKLEEL